MRSADLTGSIARFRRRKPSCTPTPPHATAYAITGRLPARLVIPEYEVFIGQVARARHETPGTRAFAESVLPHVRTHNTVLLANHGVVCWADSVTRAEWHTRHVIR